MVYASPSLLRPNKLLDMGGIIDPSAGYALYLPFSAASPTYRSGANTYTDPTLLPGYTYTRSGAKSELSASGPPIAFAANVPGIVPGQGFYSRGAFTNNALQSSALATAPWVGAGTASATNAVGAAPDGTNTASRVVVPANAQSAGQSIYQLAAANSTSRTIAYFVKSNTGSNQNFAYMAGENGVSENFTEGVATTAWQRFVFVRTGLAGATNQTKLGIINPIGGTAVDVQVAMVTSYDGNFPDGGPIIATAGATASTGADVFSETVTAPADVDQIFFAKGNFPAFSGVLQLGGWIDGTTNNRVYFTYNTGVQVLVLNAGSFDVNVLCGTPPVNQDFTVLCRRLAGTWRAGLYAAGTLTWPAAATTSGMPVNLTNVNAGHYQGAAQPNGLIKSIGNKVGTFTTDADVIAALF